VFDGGQLPSWRVSCVGRSGGTIGLIKTRRSFAATEKKLLYFGVMTGIVQ
jgi:hypothetical protein